MPPTRQNEEVEHTPNGTQKRPRNANKQWATDIDDNGVSAEMHVAKWLVSINQNERLANYHRWTIGNEKKTTWRINATSTSLKRVVTVGARLKASFSK